jgi:hypothetical protein
MGLKREGTMTKCKFIYSQIARIKTDEVPEFAQENAVFREVPVE